jgi:hypothetical protein
LGSLEPVALLHSGLVPHTPGLATQVEITKLKLDKDRTKALERKNRETMKKGKGDAMEA